AMHAVWEDVVYRNFYITGGIGSSGRNEGFSVDYDLPNMQAYCETCASVGMVFWNQRMNALTGDSKFIDVLERSLYNGAQSGLSLNGDRFFYGNPLASTGTHFRREWFGTACCPANIARLTASVGDYIYAHTDDALYINLFIGSNTQIQLNKSDVAISMETDYPIDGNVKIKVSPASKSKFDIYVRIPGWVKDEPAPGNLYSFNHSATLNYTIMLNGKDIAYEYNHGYAVISREWVNGDEIKLHFPMEVKEVVADERVKQNNGRVALQRGPLVYCVEGADNQGKAWNFILPENTVYTTSFQPGLLGGVVTIQFEAPVVSIDDTGQNVRTSLETMTAIPYFTWANRGQNEMQVWLPRKFKQIRINPEN
ncbi:MAG TPA: glycoside hydrolase family 127 protein, partial [Saprospiraceae bacterium]|nr:glycoside hydrolase family 127 protein [Saprospiraceae bacterium]